ncbi:MAG: glycerol-3-phosphate 1-O-acyltransferase PlsY [candidate division Zixibacteria bacterium]|nr:glycerol-3-phosphate 1-O-acyltransferase PlsY [candidate division Zixibacteria bacterium]
MIEFISALIISYLAGGIPTAIIAGKILKGIDIRDYGSGNAGATNVFRVLGPVPAIAVILIDAGKGVLAVLLISTIVPPSFINDVDGVRIICGLAAILGHNLPVWAGFRGGKGVGTGAGVMFSVLPLETGIAVLCFAVVVALTRYVSLGSMIAATVLPVLLLIEKFYLGYVISDILLGVCIFTCLFVIISHRSNIRRLIAGKENKIGKRVKL